MSRDNNSKGIVLILIAMSLFAIQDSLIKFIFEKSALYEIFFGRYLIAAMVLFIYLSFKRQKVSFKTHYPLLTLVRVLLHFVAFSTFFISITYMQLATANALFFSCPFFVSIFAKFFLKEFIGIRRWSAIAFGFFGVLIVLNPNFENFDYAFSATTEQEAINEECLINPQTFYDVGKLANEMYLEQYVREGRLKSCITLRLSNIYGAHQISTENERGFLDRCIWNAINGANLNMYGDGNYLRDYLHIEDAVEAFYSAGKIASKTGIEVFNKNY